MARNANDFEQLYRDDPDGFVQLVTNGYGRLSAQEQYELGKFMQGALNPSFVAKITGAFTSGLPLDPTAQTRPLERLSDDQFSQIQSRWNNRISDDYKKLGSIFGPSEGDDAFVSEEDAALEAESFQFGTRDGVPLWLYESFPSDHPFWRDAAARDRILQRLVLYFNTQFGQEFSGTPILSSPEEVIEYLTRMGPETEIVQTLVSFAAADVQPDAGFRIALSNGSSVFVTASDQQVMSDIYGMRAEDITAMVRMVDMVAGSAEFAAATDGFEFFPNGMEGVNYKAFAALFKMNGHLEMIMQDNRVDTADLMASSVQNPNLNRFVDLYTDTTQPLGQQPFQVPEQQTVTDRNGLNLGLTRVQPFGGLGEAIDRRRQAVQRQGSSPGDQFGLSGSLPSYITENVRQPTSVSRTLTTFAQGLSVYQGHEGMALMHAFNPTMASNAVLEIQQQGIMSQQTGIQVLNFANTLGMNAVDARRLFDTGAMVQRANEFLGIDTYIAMSEVWAGGGRRGGGSRGGGMVRMLPDQDAVRQSVRDMYTQMFLESPSDEVVAAMVNALNSAVMSAPSDQSVDVQAKLRDILERDPAYNRLYGQMPDGFTAEQFQGMNRAAQETMLGDMVESTEALQIGMQDGSYRTTMGASMGLEEAWDNSTFLGRLARAAQVVSANT